MATYSLPSDSRRGACDQSSSACQTERRRERLCKACERHGGRKVELRSGVLRWWWVGKEGGKGKMAVQSLIAQACRLDRLGAES